MQNTHWKITQPCHESIANMDVTEKGHYCHRCEKEVLDLDGIHPNEIGYKEGDQLCGRIKATATLPVQLYQPGRWSSFLLKWMGVWALFFLPMKKGKTQDTTGTRKNEPVDQKKNLQNTRRIVGVVRGTDNKPLRTEVQLTDSTGKIIATTHSIANGKYLMDIDTSKIAGDSLTLTAKDTGYVWSLDTSLVVFYPKDSIYVCNLQHVVTMGAVIEIGWTTQLVLPVTITITPEDAGDALGMEAQAGVQGIDHVKG